MDGIGDSVEILRGAAAPAGLCAIPLERIATRGYRGIILDLDNTSCAYGDAEVAEGVAEWVAAAQAAGLRIVLLSNNFSERVEAIGAQLSVATVPRALKPLPFGFWRALRLLGTRRHETVVIGDQLFTDVLGAKLIGVDAILTEPLAPHDFVLTRVLRLLERMLFRRILS